jgi:hypothetical protein
VPQQHPGGGTPRVKRMSYDIAGSNKHPVIPTLQDLLRHDSVSALAIGNRAG